MAICPVCKDPIRPNRKHTDPWAHAHGDYCGVWYYKGCNCGLTSDLITITVTRTPFHKEPFYTFASDLDTKNSYWWFRGEEKKHAVGGYHV